MENYRFKKDTKVKATRGGSLYIDHKDLLENDGFQEIVKVLKGEARPLTPPAQD